MSSHHFSFERRCNPSCALLWKNGHQDAVESLLAAGATISREGKNWTKVHEAAAAGGNPAMLPGRRKSLHVSTNKQQESFFVFWMSCLMSFWNNLGSKMSRVTRFAKSVDGFPSLELLSNHGLLLDAKDSSGGGYWDVPGDLRNGATVPCRLVSALKCCFCVIAWLASWHHGMTLLGRQHIWAITIRARLFSQLGCTSGLSRVNFMKVRVFADFCLRMLGRFGIS